MSEGSAESRGSGLPPASPYDRVGDVCTARSIAHHGEILQGVFEDNGQLRYGLVTLPRDDMKSTVTFEPTPASEVSVEPAWKWKAKRAAELTVAHCKASIRGGRLRIVSEIPVNYGFGSSTSDVTATVRAVASSLGVFLSPERIALLAVEAEVASDSIMIEHRTVLFAQREGLVIEDLGPALPHVEVIGFSTDPSNLGITTLEFPVPRYTWQEVQQFKPLIGLLRMAVSARSPRYVGRVASASARINQRYLPVPRFDDLERLVELVGAVGLQVAHSGTIAGLIFDPATADKVIRFDDAMRRLAEHGFGPVWHFHSGLHVIP